jgi:dTDP-4-amino-4,6-dideoxygalactose transaminase
MKDFTNNAHFIVEFEKRLAEYAGSKEAVVVDSCSNALFLSLFVLNTFAEKNHKIPANTYISVPFAMINAGFNPIFEDIKWDGMYQLGTLPIIDGAVYFSRGMYVKNSLHCLSFHEKKILKIGKGGAILTDDSQLATNLRRLAFDGRDYTKGMLEDDIEFYGYHMNMPPADAAKGLMLLNQISDKNPSCGNNTTYRDLRTFKIFKNEYIDYNTTSG